MEQQSSELIVEDSDIKAISGLEAEFHDAVEESSSVDASSCYEFEQSPVSSECDSNKDEEATISVLLEHSQDCLSSPSSTGLRHRRLVSQRSSTEFPHSQFLKNNPDGLIDFDPNNATSSPGKKYERSSSLKDDEKLNGKLDSGPVQSSSGSDDSLINEETDESSVITSVNSDGRINDQYVTGDSLDTVQYVLSTLAELVIKAIGFQSKFLASSVTFPLRLMYTSYMFVIDPFGIMRHGRSYMLENVSRIWGVCYSGLKWIIHLWIKNPESARNLCFRVGWGLLWLAYCGVVLIGLLIPAFLLGGMMMKWIVEEPIQITKQLTFDYSRDTPMAYVPIISCPDSSPLELSEKSKIWSSSSTGSRVIPFDHELQATVSLTMPESDYNRNLGIFQVRVDFLSSDGRPLGSTRQPCMLQFRSEPIRLLSTFLQLVPLLTGYSSETQTLDVKFTGYAEKHVPTSCSRVVIEQRAEFAKGGGVPEIYSASLKLESQLPFVKRMMWYGKGVIYLWVSMMLFTTELLLTLLCCTPIIFPWLRHGHGGVSSNNNAYHSTPPGLIKGDGNKKVLSTALQLAVSMKRDWIQTGRKPSGICAAAIYVSSVLHGYNFSRADVVKAVHICEATLTKRLIEFENTKAGSLMIEEFTEHAMAFEKEMQSCKQSVKDPKMPGLTEVVCQHKGNAVQSGFGLCKNCYLEFCGGLDGSEPPAFQRAEMERLAMEPVEKSTESASCL